MNFLANVLTELVSELIRRELLLLHDPESQPALVREIQARIATAPQWSKASTHLSTSLVESELVDELFANDRELLDILQELHAP